MTIEPPTIPPGVCRQRQYDSTHERAWLVVPVQWSPGHGEIVWQPLSMKGIFFDYGDGKFLWKNHARPGQQVIGGCNCENCRRIDRRYVAETVGVTIAELLKWENAAKREWAFSDAEARRAIQLSR